MPSLIERIDSLDKAASLASTSMRLRPLTAFLVFLWYSGTVLVWLPAAVVFIALLRSGYQGIPGLLLIVAAMTGGLLSLFFGEAIKAVIRRPRPYEAMPDHQTAIARPKDKSMPSTHASSAVALFVGLLAAGHPVAWFVAPWSALVVFSRYYLGVHYPTDLLAGSLLGVVFGLVDWTWLVRALVL